MAELVKSNPFHGLKQKGKKKIIVIGLSVLLVSGAGVFAYQQWMAPQQTSTVMRMESVKRGDVTESIASSGTVQASKRISLSPNADEATTITAIHVKVGDEVKAGQVLATLDDAAARIQVIAAEARLLSAKAKLTEAQKAKTTAELKTLQAKVTQTKAAWDAAQKGYSTQKALTSLEKAKTSLQNAQNTYNTQKNLFEAGIISKNEWDQAKTSVEQAQLEYNAAVLENNQTQGQLQSEIEQAQAAYETAVSDLNEAKSGTDVSTIQTAQAEVEQAAADLQEKKDILNNLIVKAPIDGMIVEINGNLGEVPSQPFIVMDNSNSGNLEVLAQISESDIGKVKEGLTSTFTTNSFSDKEFKGKVTLVYPEATTDSGVTSYKVLLSVDNKDRLLKTGMSMNVNIEVGTHKDVLYVPVAALKTQNGKDGVFVSTSQSSDNPAGSEQGRMPYRFVPVTVGYYSSDKVEITSGLNEGDKIVLTMNNTSQTSTNRNQPNGMGIPGLGGPGMGGAGGMGGQGGSTRGNR
ncbi:efflux RND transporter periplasmic adaptor subunit [Brevibacillus sp. SYSU BS000544]|uniref:efflux RND transporter periplasmic adaptor subunit n=1 Tax=Brevibacillus sp. SYSU BS000544 TaxID=3416443 RepID=UPI003CE54FDE